MRPGSTFHSLLRAWTRATRIALGVLQRDRVLVFRRVAILEHDAGDAERVEPAGNVVSFVGDRKVLVAAAGADNDGRAVGLVGGWQIGANARHILVAVLHAGRGTGPERLQRRLRFLVAARLARLRQAQESQAEQEQQDVPHESALRMVESQVLWQL